ncbi:uncharacterized protein BO80DRAFT_498065 [Aspergillus ibericus CBS 121593]|uniref:Uncharacterized protein n=1 Tax=Aspergillus ibericus CBS 121593 TaxID=1448316 RepID=A0A395GLY2_9EURO|nr:hypothetical protein BO80DRAFT_498065 [Aspergillus ibericus CBS 121593]RAK95033.1 hypothetical protein BO80DRAFT_498065 [Aspergillus ibericus CBS 121593]
MANVDTLDISEIRRTTWELYRFCDSISGNAPDGFRQLVANLQSLHNLFQKWKDDPTSKNSEVGHDEERKHNLQRCLKSCSSTLQQLKEVVKMYQASGFGTGEQLWQTIDWTTQQAFIDDVNTKIVAHKCHLGLCVSSNHKSPLERTESAATESSAKDLPPLAPSSLQMQDEVSPTSFSVPTPRLHDVHIMPELDGTEVPNRNPARTNTKHSPTPGHTRVSTSSESFVSGQSDGSIFTATTRTSPSTPATASFSPLSMAPPEAYCTEKEVVWARGPGSGISSVQYQRQIQRSNSIKPGESILWGSPAHAGADAIQELHQRQWREQLLRSLRCEPRDRFHQPDAELLVKFETLSHKEERPQHLTTKGWLLVAVWWLLKARTALANSEMPSLVSQRGSTSASTVSSIASHQAYVDLLKASYILYDIVLRVESPQVLLEDENRKLISDLSEGIKEDFAQFSSVDVPDYAAIHSQNLDIWEPIQPEETTVSEGLASSPGNISYVTVELEDGGNEDEQVLFRTFVNAGIGSKKLRMRTRGAPYMLLLSTRYGESEPKVTICNQSGSFCLQRDLTPGDLTQLMQVSNASLAGLPAIRAAEPVTLKFDTMSVSISFQYLSDMMQVINIPKAYFDAVQLREPLESDEFTETVVFKSSAESLEQLRMPTMTSSRPPTVHLSCEVRILERSFKEAWRSVRRIVICSSTADQNGRMIEYFMPLSHVQVSRTKTAGLVLLKWSDTGQERSGKTDGNYHPLFSYVYDSSNPNIGIGIQFRSEEQADALEKAILGRNIKPVFTWSQTKSSGQVYDVVDAALDGKRYKAVMLCRTRGEWKQCGLHYLYRDMDYVYEHSTLRVKFPHALNATYISSHVDQLYRADQRVFFSHCEKELREVVVEFHDEHVLRAFMTSLASSHELIFSRRANSLMTKEKLLFGPKKSVKGYSQVQLWRDAETLRLAARWNDHIMDRWLTMTIPPGELTRSGNLISFPSSSYSRGMILNMSKIAAGSAKNLSREHKTGPITILFPDIKDREEFVAAIAGMHMK